MDPQEDGEAFWVYFDSDLTLAIYPDQCYARLVKQRQYDLIQPEARRTFDRIHHGLSSHVEPDKQGRILLPERLISRARIGRNVTLVGAGDRLELWDRARWEAYVEQNLPQMGRLQDRVSET